MGTGIVSILLLDLPYHFSGARQISLAVYVLNVALFIIFFVLYVPPIHSTQRTDAESGPSGATLLRSMDCDE